MMKIVAKPRHYPLDTGHSSSAGSLRLGWCKQSSTRRSCHWLYRGRIFQNPCTEMDNNKLYETRMGFLEFKLIPAFNLLENIAIHWS